MEVLWAWASSDPEIIGALGLMIGAGFSVPLFKYGAQVLMHLISERSERSAGTPLTTVPTDALVLAPRELADADRAVVEDIAQRTGEIKGDLLRIERRLEKVDDRVVDLIMMRK